MSFFKKEQNNVSVPEETNAKENSVAVVKEEYVWVEGYKGLDIEMKAIKGDGMQYELGKEYEMSGDIELCERGFHFCATLKDTFKYYKVGRYFKVKAYISVSDLEYFQPAADGRPRRFFNSGTYDYYYPLGQEINKFVAKKIILTEEIPFSEICKYNRTFKHDLIDNEEDYYKYAKDSDAFIINKILVSIRDCFSSYDFSNIVAKAIAGGEKDYRNEIMIVNVLYKEFQSYDEFLKVMLERYKI